MSESIKFYHITFKPNQWKKCGGCNWHVRKVWRYGKEPIDKDQDPEYADGLCCYCMSEFIRDEALDMGSKAAARALSQCEEEIAREKRIGARQGKVSIRQKKVRGH